VFALEGLSRADAREVSVTATPEKGKPIKFTARLRIDTPKEREYYRHGGILQYVLRQLAASGGAA
jgi:aconitate hydratase